MNLLTSMEKEEMMPFLMALSMLNQYLMLCGLMSSIQRISTRPTTVSNISVWHSAIVMSPWTWWPLSSGMRSAIVESLSTQLHYSAKIVCSLRLPTTCICLCHVTSVKILTIPFMWSDHNSLPASQNWH